MPTRRERPPEPVVQKKSAPLPRWIPFCLVLLFLVGSGLLTANLLMVRYLNAQEQARVEAHQALLENYHVVEK